MKDYQLHKIRGVDKAVCSCEQKLAYNYAADFRNLNLSGASAGIMLLKWKEGDTRYNWKAVAHLLSMHLDKYRAAKYHILTSYEAIGKMFPVRIDD